MLHPWGITYIPGSEPDCSLVTCETSQICVDGTCVPKISIAKNSMRKWRCNFLKFFNKHQKHRSLETEILQNLLRKGGRKGKGNTLFLHDLDSTGITSIAACVVDSDCRFTEFCFLEHCVLKESQWWMCCTIITITLQYPVKIYDESSEIFLRSRKLTLRKSLKLTSEVI